MTEQTTVDVLRAAKAVLQRNGLHKGGFFDMDAMLAGTPRDECPVCIWGAVNIAQGLAPDADDYAAQLSGTEKALMDALGSSFPYIAAWNDAPDRTLYDVYLLLDRAIALASAGGFR